MPIESSRPLPGKDLIALTRPPSERPNLILLHGFTGSPHSWDTLVPELEAKYRVTRPFLPGHHPYDDQCPGFSEAAARVARLLGELTPPRILLGYSLGGRLALYSTIHYPNLVEKLILESATPGIEDEGERRARKQADDQLAQQIRLHGISWFADYWANNPLFRSHQRLSAEVRAAQHKERMNHSAEGLAHSLENMGAGVMQPMWARLASLACPLHLITGSLDNRYSGIARSIQLLLPRAKHTIIDEVGHTPHLESPATFLSALLH